MFVGFSDLRFLGFRVWSLGFRAGNHGSHADDGRDCRDDCNADYLKDDNSGIHGKIVCHVHMASVTSCKCDKHATRG